MAKGDPDGLWQTRREDGRFRRGRADVPLLQRVQTSYWWLILDEEPGKVAHRDRMTEWQSH